MIRLHVIAEGPMEETFVTELLAPHLFEKGVLAGPILIGKNGGYVSYSRLKRDSVLYLKSDFTSYCTTFIDYYGLGPGFPEKAAIGEHDSPAEKKRKLEETIAQDIKETLGKRHDASHFIPYVQMYEFEGLLFSDPVRFALGIGMSEMERPFQTRVSPFSCGVGRRPPATISWVTLFNPGRGCCSAELGGLITA